MEKKQEYKKDLKTNNDLILQTKDDINFIKSYSRDYEADETYKTCMKQLGELIFIKSWLENKLEINLVK